MRGNELLEELLAAFRQAAPQAEFRRAYEPENALRLGEKILAAGSVLREKSAGDGWEVKLGFTLYLPRGARPGAGESILDKMSQAAGSLDNAPLAEMERGAPGVDKATGRISVACWFLFAPPGQTGGTGNRKTYPVRINDQELQVSGWKASQGESGRALRAIGEDEPFFTQKKTEYTVELQGLSGAEGMSEWTDFTLRLGNQAGTYRHCRWKSISAGGTGVLTGVLEKGE